LVEWAELRWGQGFKYYDREECLTRSNELRLTMVQCLTTVEHSIVKTAPLGQICCDMWESLSSTAQCLLGKRSRGMYVALATLCQAAEDVLVATRPVKDAKHGA
jgi:hypothetical protein